MDTLGELSNNYCVVILFYNILPFSTTVSYENGILLLFRISYAGRKNELNLSKGIIDPKRFWPVRMDKNESLGSRSENNKAVMYNVELEQLSIPRAAFDTDALVFTGNADSFVQIYNTDNSLQATDAICIAFYVYSEDSNQTGVLLEYFGTDYNSGLRIVYNKTNIDVNFYDGSGNLIYKNSSITVPADTWKLIGINFNRLWDIGDQFDVFDIVLGQVTKSTLDHESSIPSIDAVGDIKLGGSFDGSCSFKGKISCIQFYNYSHIGGLQKDIEDLCNSALLSTPDMGENTYSSTSGNLSSTVQSFSTCEPFPRRTTAAIATSTMPVTVSTVPVESGSTYVIQTLDSCHRWYLLVEDFSFTSIIYSSQERSLHACARSCANKTDCRAFAFSINADHHGNHECSLNKNIKNLQSNVGFRIYEMK